MEEKLESPSAPATLAQYQAHPPIVHLGKLKEKLSKKIKKGKLNDKLAAKLQQAISRVQVGVGEENTPVIISFEEKPRKKSKKIKLLGLKIDRKKLKSKMKKSGISSKLF